MNDEAAFTRAMEEHPEDTLLRVAFADWLEERGDSRGELIRLLHTLTQAVIVPDRDKLEDRLRSLVASGVQPVGPFWTNSIGMTFAWVPAGTFLMGSPKTEEKSFDSGRQHKVTLTKGFYLGVYSVTQHFWREVMGTNPSDHQGDDLPVEQVSWDSCAEFLKKLSEREGDFYQMPTESEWEYACRAGTTTPFFFGNTISTSHANYSGTNMAYRKGELGNTTTVGNFSPNAWGLHDMHGNVWEWCADWIGPYPQGHVVDPPGFHEGDYRVVRGGSFIDQASGLRSGKRCGLRPTSHDNFYGFRAARSFLS